MAAGGKTWTAAEITGRLGFSSIALDMQRRLTAEGIAAARRAGLERMEISYGSAHFDWRDPAHVREIAGECGKQGIALVSAHLPYHVKDLGAEDPAQRAPAVREVLDAVQIACEMGARVGVLHWSGTEGYRASLEQIAARLDGLPFTVALENGARIAPVQELVRAVGSPQVRMVLDIGHARDKAGDNPFCTEPGAYAALRECADQLVHVHLHDFHLTDHLPPFAGTIAWDAVLGALRDIGYRGPLLFEVHCGHPQALPERQRTELHALLATASDETLHEAGSVPFLALLRGRRPGLTPGTPAHALATDLGRALKEVCRLNLRATTEQALAAVAGFPAEFVRRYGTHASPRTVRSG